MFKSFLITCAIFLAVILNVSGQQDVSFSQYMFDKMLVNPAYAGSSKWVVGSLKNRTMISKIKGVPLTNIFTFQAPIQTKSIGLGLKIIQDKIAITNTLAIDGVFSYHIGFGRGKLSFGIEAGGIRNSYDYDQLIRVEGDDPAIPTGKQAYFIPDVSTGVYYQNDKFYLGGTAYHLFNRKKNVLSYTQSEINIVSKNYCALGGLFLEIKKDIIIEPGFLIKYVSGAPVQLDLNTSLVFVDKMAFGVSYRTGDAIIGMFKFDITKNLKISYSYDYVLSRLSSFSMGNHELSISYGIELLPPPAKKVIHPRYYF
jgi:type IX secretion system PorP/SprF family membrane protein